MKAKHERNEATGPRSTVQVAHGWGIVERCNRRRYGWKRDVKCKKI